MAPPRSARLASNWTTAAGAVEGILAFLNLPLPRYAIMGLSGHAWHTCLGSREGVVALPSGPVDLDWGAMVDRYSRTGVRWERFAAEVALNTDADATREEAIDWAIARLDAGKPLVGWDFHLHEFGVLYDYDRDKQAFVVDSVLTEEVGPIAHWRDWPSAATGRIELFAPGEAFEPDPLETVMGSLETALECLSGRDGNGDGQPRGTAALHAWADALGSDVEVDRAGNAYTLAVLQAARLDGADFLASLAENLPTLAEQLRAAERAIRDETAALSPLLTLFPFPTGGHGNVQSPGLREAAAVALRKAAGHERRAAEHIESVLLALRE
jgi:hypothetical protein